MKLKIGLNAAFLLGSASGAVLFASWSLNGFAGFLALFGFCAVSGWFLVATAQDEESDPDLSTELAATTEMLMAALARVRALERGEGGEEEAGPGPTPSIVCPRCRRVSYHPRDIEQGYCGYCHWWTSDPHLGSIEPPRRQ